MSKIKKKDLTRGNKLTPENIWRDNLDGVATNINRAAEADGLIQPMYDSGNGTFRLTWNIPYIGSEWTRVNGTTKPYIIPFCVLPLQNFITANATTNQDVPQIFMTEFSWGFDSRGEDAYITDHTCGAGPGAVGGPGNNWSEYMRTIIGAPPGGDAGFGPVAATDWAGYFTNQNHGKLSYEAARRGDFKFSILKKQMQYFNVDASNKPVDSIYDVPLSAVDLAGRNSRNNPGNEANLNVEFDPYSTYCLAINLPQLDDPDTTATSDEINLAIVNLTISIKFKTRMILRDTVPANPAVGPNPIGIPENGGLKQNDNVTLNVPAVGAAISADTATGVNTSLVTLDEKFRNKLNSGYDASSNKPTVEQLAQDSGYEIIAIPIWNNQFNNMVTGRSAMEGLHGYSHGRYGGVNVAHPGPTPVAGTYNDYINPWAPMNARAIVPINYPFTIHHVILAANVFTAAFKGDTATWHKDVFMDAYPDQGDAVPTSAIDIGAPGWVLASNVRTRHEIGIGIGTGLRGTRYGYRQVVDYTGANSIDFTQPIMELDKIRMNYNATTSRDNGGDNDILDNSLYTIPEPNYEWKLFNLPLNGSGVAGMSPGLFDNAAPFGKSTPATYLTQQDPPVFCGQSYIHRDVAGAAGGGTLPSAYDGTSVRYDAPNAATQDTQYDQWIEVRWLTHSEDFAGNAINWSAWAGTGGPQGAVAPVAAADFMGKANESKIIHGYGGHWIYLIGKKTAVSTANWKNTNLKEGM